MNTDNTNKRISQQIDLFLKTSVLPEDIINTVREWIQTANMYKGKQYTWAHLLLTAGNESCENPDKCLPGTIAMELFALAADIFDDIEDEDNNSMPWRIVPSAQAINMASCILVLSFQALSAIEDPCHYRQVNATFQQMGLKACLGQALEFYNENQTSIISLEQYFEMIGKKSGALTEGACKIGAILADYSPDIIQDFGNFGQKLGVISQVTNDLFDYTKIDTKSDFCRSKKTLPLVYLENVLKIKTEELQEFHSMVQNDRQEVDSEIKKRLHQFIRKEGAAHYCAAVCSLIRQQAIEILNRMQITEEHRKKLKELVG